MNRMPGFTAEHSVGGLHRNYGGKVITSPARMNSVRAQRLTIRNPPGTCIPNCVCVGPYECPCCTFEEQWGRGPRRPRPWPF
jgi:hypothetical protein